MAIYQQNMLRFEDAEQQLLSASRGNERIVREQFAQMRELYEQVQHSYPDYPIRVSLAGTHIVRGARCPVIHLECDALQLHVLLSSDTHHYTASVESTFPISLHALGKRFDPHKWVFAGRAPATIKAHTGFPIQYQKPAYAGNTKAFSLHLRQTGDVALLLDETMRHLHWRAEHMAEHPHADSHKLEEFRLAHYVPDYEAQKDKIDAQFAQWKTWRDVMHEACAGHYIREEVVGTYWQKGIPLPIVQLSTLAGLSLIARDDFHTIKVTVTSPHPITDPAVTALFDPNALEQNYLPELPVIHGAYAENNQQFTVTLNRHDPEALYALTRLIASQQPHEAMPLSHTEKLRLQLNTATRSR